jgi:hypothetical protein
MPYQDFEIKIQAQPRGRFKTEAESPFGPGQAPFKLPFSKEDLQGVPDQFDILLDRQSTEKPRFTMEQIGEALYESLFAGKVGQRFHESLANLPGNGPDERLRVRLNLDLQDPRLRALSLLPWELVRDAERGDFLSRLQTVSFVRYLPVSRPPLQRLTGPLKVLVAMAAPSDLDSLDLEKEWKNIWGELKQNPEISVTSILQPSLADLRKKLLGDDWHVLHFLGHGGFDEQSGEGTVCFVRPDGKRESITGTMLAEHLKSLPSLRLVFLNACDGGKLPRREGQDPYRATATALVQAGIPAVIAMQTPIYDTAAIALGAGFYERLAARESVDAALAAGRLAIVRINFNDWATPVLFTRIKDGNILGEEGNGEARRSGSPASVLETQPLRLGIRTFSDTGGVFVWGQEMDQECDEILDLRPFFTGKGNRYIKDPAFWRTEITPRLREFLAGAATTRRRLHLNLAAHASLAFAAGFMLNVKSGLDITLRQRVRGADPVQEWRVAAVAPDHEEKLFRELPDLPGDAQSSDVAMALGITRSILPDVQHYLERAPLAVGRTLAVEPAAGPSWNSVRDGLHALRMAEVLASKMTARTIEERYGVLHLFASAPNALLFFLGQLSHGLGRIQLYEHDFESGLPGAYIPSLLLPPIEEKSAEA